MTLEDLEATYNEVTRLAGELGVKLREVEAAESAQPEAFRLPAAARERFAYVQKALTVLNLLPVGDPPKDLLSKAPGHLNRFSCGRIWYSLKEPWTAPRLADARRIFAFPDSATHDQLERRAHLHFHFQRLYRKPIDDWSDDDEREWGSLEFFVDVAVYQADNPPTENRIGRLLHCDPDKVAILWSSRGEIAYDSHLVPPELLTAPLGWLVHAEFQIENGVEQWLSTRIEPPVAPDYEVTDEDISDARVHPPAKLPLADWPKVGA